MINYLTFLFCGSYFITVSEKYKEIAVNYLYRNKIKYKNLQITDRSEISFQILSFTSKKLTDDFNKMGIPYSSSTLCGIPRFLTKYSNRHGILLGIILFSIFVPLSQNYVWYMDVKGCENISHKSVIENLEALGFTYGTNFKKIDFDYLRHNYLAANDDLSWISINMQGTYAHIEVRELQDPPKKETSGCTNIVASENGQIVIVESFEGTPVVKPGDFISKGELLISGIMTSGEDTLRYERADGKVLAQVERKFKAVIPKFNNKKTYIGDETVEREIIFFKKTVKVSGNCRISHAEYDTIITKEQLNLFDTVDLPVFFNTKLHRPYISESIPLSEAELYGLKKKLISERTAETTADAELLEITTCEYENDSEIIIIGTVICIADIGEITEVEITN